MSDPTPLTAVQKTHQRIQLLEQIRDAKRRLRDPATRAQAQIDHDALQAALKARGDE